MFHLRRAPRAAACTAAVLLCIASTATSMALGTALAGAAGGKEPEACLRTPDGKRFHAPAVRRTHRDLDRDGTLNRRDADMDGDRRRNRLDRNVDGDSRLNRRDREMDADRIPNAVDRDVDGDRVFNKADRGTELIQDQLTMKAEAAWMGMNPPPFLT